MVVVHVAPELFMRQSYGAVASERERLPAGLHNARNLALEREATEAQTAYAELSQERTRPATELAAVVLT